MDFQELVKFRRSSRWVFSKRQVSDEDLKKILEAAQYAPTPHNRQPFEIIVVKDRNVIKQISEVEIRLSKEEVDGHIFWTRSKKELESKGVGVQMDVVPKFVHDLKDKPELIDDDEFWKKTMGLFSIVMQATSVLLIVIFDPKLPGIGPLKNLWGILGVGAVMQNIWLAANDLGISVHLVSSQTMRVESIRKLHEILNIPKDYRILFLFRLGYEGKFGKYGTPYRRKLEDFVHLNRFSNKFTFKK